MPRRPEKEYRYDVFLSYATETDRELAQRLELIVESFHTLSTVEPLDLGPLAICVDGSDFTTPQGSHDTVPEVIMDHLSRSSELLVLCSKSARDSRWIEMEIEWFLQNRSAQAIRVGITSGDPTAHPSGVFSPLMLRAGFREKLWYDFRSFHDNDQTGVGRPAFEDECVRLIADLVKKPPSALRPYWFRHQMREKQRLEELNRELLEQRDKAERRARIAEAHSLAAHSGLLAPKRPPTAILLAVEAIAATRDLGIRVPAAQQALRACLSSFEGRAIRVPGPPVPVNALAVSSDSAVLAVAARSGVFLWNARKAWSTRPIATLDCNDSNVLTFTRDSDYLVSGAKDGMVRIWLVTEGNPEGDSASFVGHQAAIWYAVAGANARQFVTAGWDKSVRLWQIGRGCSEVHEIELGGDIGRGGRIAMSQDGKWILVANDILAGESPDLPSFRDPWADPVPAPRLWKLAENGTPEAMFLLEGHGSDENEPHRYYMRGTNAVAITTDSRLGITAGADGTVRTWDLTSEDPSMASVVMRLRQPGQLGSVRSLAVDPGNGWLAAAMGSEIYAWARPATDRPPVRLQSEHSTVMDLAVNNNGTMLVSGDADGLITVWDVLERNVRKHAELRGHEGPVDEIAFLDQRRFATRSRDGSCRVWDPLDRRGAAVRVLELPPEYSDPMADAHLMVSRGGRWLGVRSSHELTMVRATTSTSKRWRMLGKGERHVSAGAFDPTGSFFCDGDQEGCICVWRPNERGDWQLAGQVDAHEEWVEEITFSPDGRWLVSSGDDGCLHVWAVDKHMLRTTADATMHVPGVSQFRFGGDSRCLAATSREGGVSIYRLEGSEWREHEVLDPGQHELEGVALGPTSGLMAIGSWGAVVSVWQLGKKGSRHIGSLKPLGGVAGELMFACGERWLVAGAWEGDVRLVEVDSLTERGIILERFSRSMSVSPHDRWLFVGLNDGSFRLCDLTQDDPVNSLTTFETGAQGSVQGQFLSAHRLVTLCEGTLQTWDLSIRQALKRAAQLAGRNLTKEEWRVYMPNRRYRKTFRKWPSGPERSPTG